MFKESSLRSFAKAVSNRILNTAATVTLVYLFTDQVAVALSVGAAEVIVKFALFYVHERTWDKVKFGKKQKSSFVLWFTGLPFSGKSLLADEVFERITKQGAQVHRLDGDDVKTLFPLQGFTREERNAYLKRMGYFANILQSNGVIVIASFISPFEESRKYNRSNIGRYIEIYISTPLKECKKRDPWGLYKKAKKGELSNFIGVHEKYEKPKNPEITIDLSKLSIKEASKIVLRYIYRISK